MSNHYGINILDFGAKGDGKNDDTSAIQEAIDLLSCRGGGKIYFPYTASGYRISKPAQESIDKKPCRSQLYIPYKENLRPNIEFEGEMPCQLLNAYRIRSPHTKSMQATVFDFPKVNTFIFSDWDAPEENNANHRPYSLLGGLEGDSCAGHFGAALVSIKNLEFQVNLNPQKMYPTMSAVNLQNISRINIQDSQFCLNRNIGDFFLGKELLQNPCHTAGLICSGHQNDNQILSNVAAQGFKYGIVMGEHVVASSLYLHNCEYALVFGCMTHQTMIQGITAQLNKNIVAALPVDLFNMERGPNFIDIGCISYEDGRNENLKPSCDIMEYGVYDPENRLYGTIKYHSGWHANWKTTKEFFPVCGGKNLLVSSKNPSFFPAE